SPGRAGRWVPRPARRSLRPVVRPASPRRGADQSSLEQPARRIGQSILQRLVSTFLEPPLPSPSRLFALVLCWRLTRRPVPLTVLGRRVIASGRAAGRSVPGLSRAALVRCPAAFGLGAGVDRHVDAEGVAALESTGEDRELLVPAVGEDVVALEGQPAEVLGRTGILLELVDPGRLLLRQSDLRGEDRIVRIDDGLGVREHLEVQVRPAARIAAREDAGKGDGTGLV